jgi:hypothetical protein
MGARLTETKAMTMNRFIASKHSSRSRGFTLIASLLILVLLSGLAIGMIYMANGSQKIGGNDLEANAAYYGAESGMEKMTANIAALYQSNLAPTPTQLNAVALQYPTNAEVPNMLYQQSITWVPDANGNPSSTTSVISQGPNAGLTAEIIPLTLNSAATRPAGANANMTRGVEVALIPVFQFGVFSDSDLSYFAGPPFTFQGRVHTNGNLFLAANNGPLVLDAKVTAFRNIFRSPLANGNTSGYTGNVYVPTATGGCDGYNGTGGVPTYCGLFTMTDGSWSGAYPPGGSSNAGWVNISTTTFNGMIGNNASTGVKQLVLPFVQGGGSQIEIIRKPPGTAELPGSPLGASREYNKANIRILLADTVADLHRERGTVALDAQDVDLTNGCAAGGVTIPLTGPAVNQPFAWGAPAQDANWVVTSGGSPCTQAGPKWPLITGWLRVEYLNTAGVWVGVTNEWLQYGFGRGLTPPTTPGGNTLPSNRYAILIFQQEAQRGTGLGVWGAPNTQTSQFAYYPINFVDEREAFPRNTTSLAGTNCNVNGIMSAVELDIGNLAKWLNGTITPAGSGLSVSYTSQNGYLVYFSDRRGMVGDPNSVAPYTNMTSGESGIEDVVNLASATGIPDQTLEPQTPGYNNSDSLSPEDVDGNGVLDNWGQKNIGFGFGINTTNVAPYNPYQPVNCATIGRANRISGARHVLRLIDGSLGNLPVRGDNGLGGFTVAAENPVYILGDYNSNAGDPFWASPTTNPDVPHSDAAVIADAITLLSNNWNDIVDMNNSNNLGGRTGSSTYYRTAIAAGKNRNFPQSGYEQDFGTDGGLHNFLRYLESWGSPLYYRGSLVSLYYAQYGTGTYKSGLVYGPPSRNYYFDTDFLNPVNLPPGTPELQDVNNLSYWQNFQAY